MSKHSGHQAAVSIVAAALPLAGAAAAWGAGTHIMVCELRGGQEVPPSSSPSRGCGRFVVDTDANTVSFYIVFEDLLSAETAAHLHGFAGPGTEAPPLFTLAPGNIKAGVWNYAEPMEQDILDGNLYVNVHSTLFPDGEIRGQVVDFVASLDDAQEVGGATCPTASGWGLFNVDECADTMSYYIVIEGALCLAETAAHIHGPATHGEAGPILEPLPAGTLKTGVWTYPAALEEAILQGNTYVNVHTDLFPSGAIRGQITNIVVPLDGAQVTPPSGSTATGCGFMSIDKADNRLGFYIRSSTFLSLETGAAIHGFAPAGANAPPMFSLPAGNPKVGFWDYDPVLEDGILDGMTYVRIDTLLNSDGEIRGQIEVPAKKGVQCCPWDIDADGTVGINDLLDLLAAWGPNPGHPADFDGSGDVGITDLLELLANWGPCP